VSQDDKFENKNMCSRIVLESCIHGIKDFLELQTASKSGIHKVLLSNDIQAFEIYVCILLQLMRTSLYTLCLLSNSHSPFSYMLVL
jgi:hypothetical protein